MFTCTRCGHQFDSSEAKVGTISLLRTGCCKGCHAEYVRNKHIADRGKKFPQDHVTCNYCDRDMSKFEYRGRKKQEIKACKFCGSEDIESIA